MRVDAKLLKVMSQLQILLDKGNITFNNDNKQEMVVVVIVASM